jgi:hypothetical protein
MVTINYDLKLEYEARMLEKEASEKRTRRTTFNPQLADCSIGDKRRGDPKSRSAMETEERERRENEKRRVCVSGPCEGVFIGSRRRGQGPFSHGAFGFRVRIPRSHFSQRPFQRRWQNPE